MLLHRIVRSIWVRSGLLTLAVSLLGADYAAAVITQQLRLTANNPNIVTSGGQVTQWPDQSGSNRNFAAAAGAGPTISTTSINGNSKSVLNFNGSQAVTAAANFTTPAIGAMFIVVNSSEAPAFNSPDRFIFGWNNTDNPVAGIGIMPRSEQINDQSEMRVFYGRSSQQYAINTGFGSALGSGFEIISVAWGGTNRMSLERTNESGTTTTYFDDQGFLTAASNVSLPRIGAAGLSSVASFFSGNIAEVRIYTGAGDELTPSFREGIVDQLYQTWFTASAIPEPSSAFLIGTGSFALLAIRRRRTA